MDFGGILHREATDNVDARGCGRRRREGHHGGRLDLLAYLREAPVVGPEIVAPFGQAVCLVDDEQIDACLSECGGEARVGEALGRHVEQAHGRGIVEQAAAIATQRLQDRLDILAAGVARQRGDVGAADLAECLDLVAHQREQRRHHDGETQGAEGGQLVAERLARPGRHHDQRVAPVERSLHGLLLAGTEGVVAEDLAEDLMRVGSHALQSTNRAHARSARSVAGARQTPAPWCRRRMLEWMIAGAADAGDVVLAQIALHAWSATTGAGRWRAGGAD